MDDDFSDDASDVIRKTSKFNGAISQMYRLDELWKDTHRHSRLGELEKWNWDLDRVWTELAGDFDEKSNNNKDFSDINKEIGDLKDTFRALKIKKDEFQNKFYIALMKKELYLRRLQNKLGKGTEFEDEDDMLE